MNDKLYTEVDGRVIDALIVDGRLGWQDRENDQAITAALANLFEDFYERRVPVPHNDGEPQPSIAEAVVAVLEKYAAGTLRARAN